MSNRVQGVVNHYGMVKMIDMALSSRYIDMYTCVSMYNVQSATKTLRYIILWVVFND